MRGYPGSGKTTIAKELVRKLSSGPIRARVSRDDLRETLFAASGVLDYAIEEKITKIQREQVVRLVKDGFDVIVDDMNLRAKYARAWADLALELGVDFHVHDVPTSADECKRRDHERMLAGGRYVGHEVIDNIAARFPIGRWPEIKASEKPTSAWAPYVPDTSLPEAIIVDIDGTIAAKRMGEGERGWHEYHRVGEDDPKPIVIGLVRTLAETSKIIFVSGRKDHCREQTRAWLHSNVGRWTLDCQLLMRADGDNRRDDLVKAEIFEDHIAPFYNVLFTLDDRQRVVDMWRAKGLTCLQVDAWPESG